VTPTWAAWRRHQHVRLLVVALGLLAVAWLRAPRWSSPPLYDGVAFPDEPYRYVTPPPNAPKTAAPGSAFGETKVLNGHSGVLFAGSNEQGPQVQLVINEGESTGPSGATVIRVRAEPIAATAQPSDGTIWGNVYRLTAASDTGPAQIHRATNSNTQIVLRAPVGPEPQPVMEYDDGTGWRRLQTTRVGNDVYSAAIPGVGDYALVTSPGQPQPVPGAAVSGSGGIGSGGIDRWILIPGVALAILLAAMAAIRWWRSKADEGTLTGVGTDALLSFAGLVAATGPTMELSDDQHAALLTQAGRLREAASAPAPDHEQLRHLAGELLQTLAAAKPNLASQTAITVGSKAIRNLRS
jgi:hypothetical protein